MPYILALSVLVAPLYVWRFTISGVPTNFLMLWLGVVLLVGTAGIVAQGKLKEYMRYSLQTNSWFLASVVGFSVAGIISLFVEGFSLPKLGQYIVLFVLPVKLFYLVRFYIKEKPQTKTLIRGALYILLAASGILAAVQYLTLATLAPAWWGNAEEPKRAIAFFAHPNAFALFVTPVLAFLIPDFFRRLENVWHRVAANFWQNSVALLAWVLGAVGLLLSLSRGGWLGLAAAALVYGLFIGGRKYLYATLVGIVLVAGVVAVIPNLRYRVLLPFHGEKSTVSRFSLWHTGSEMVQDSPVTGKGLLGFSNNWYVYNNDPNLDHYNFPHNITLNFWIETGLLGLISFAGILLYGLWYGFANRTDIWRGGLILFIVALVVHGMIDIPYLKNDLALCFWVIFAMVIE